MHEILLIFRVFRDGTADGQWHCCTLKVNRVLLQVMKEAFDKPVAQRCNQCKFVQASTRDDRIGKIHPKALSELDEQLVFCIRIRDVAQCVKTVNIQENKGEMTFFFYVFIYDLFKAMAILKAGDRINKSNFFEMLLGFLIGGYVFFQENVISIITGKLHRNGR